MDVSAYLVHVYMALAVLYGEPTPMQQELWCLTENVLYETVGESTEGQLAVLEVVRARKQSLKYPDTYCEVVHQPSQFSWTLVDEEYRFKPTEVEVEDAAQLAYSFMMGKLPKSSVSGATHFINVDLVKRIPSWYYKYEYLGKIGNHEFFRRPKHGEVIAASKLKPQPLVSSN